jgi:uroporphyrinogen-III decarboxylase
VHDACREVIESCQTGGGLILRPGCAQSPNTPAENVHALVESAKNNSGHVAG